MRYPILLSSLLFLSVAHASVNNIAWYHLGEADAGAASGTPMTSASQDSVGTANLVPVNTPFYTNDVSSTATFATDSSLAVKFDGFSQYLDTTFLSVPSDNVGIEAWVRPGVVDGTTAYIVCNGNPNFGGWSILRNGNQYQAAIGNSTFGSGTAVAGTWTHLALVIDNGVGTLYINGVAASGSGPFPSAPSGDFIIGGRSPAPASALFNGDIDEVRVFYFNPGTFRTNDLLLNSTTVRTLPATAVTVSNAVLNGSFYITTNRATSASGWFEWGLAPSYGNTTPSQNFGTAALATNFNGSITGLAVSATYQFRAVVNPGAGPIYGTNRTFTTPGALVVTLPATTTGVLATLNGFVNPHGTNTSAWFQWGTTTNYGNTTTLQNLGNGVTNVNFSQSLPFYAGTYQYRAVASNSFGIAFGTNQTFVRGAFYDSGISLPGTFYGTVDWGDYDNDGRLDIVFANVGTNGTTEIFRNTGITFTNINAGLWLTNDGSALTNSLIARWADFDNDGRLDILLTGDGSAAIWRNNTTGFSNVLDWYHTTAVMGAVGDYDNDGHSDVVTGDYDQPFDNTKIWRNSAGGFYVPAQTPLPIDVNQAQFTWIDYNSDGRFDLQIGGELLKNFSEGSDGVFTNVIVPWPADPQATVAYAWGDFNNDGLPDLLYGSQIWQNTGSGFTLYAQVAGLDVAGAAWGDYDGDGRLDLAVSGTVSTNLSRYETQILRNTGTGFTNINAGLIGLRHSSLAWADYDNDGRLDLLMSGVTNNGFAPPITRLIHNNNTASNTPPAAPTGLTFTAMGNEVGFTWNAATDAETPSAGLTYNLRVGTAPGASDVMIANASSNGKRRLSGMGNVQYNRFFPLRNLSMNQPLYASVQAVDTSFAGSPFSEEKSFAFSVQVTPPTGAVSGDTNGDGIVSQAELDAVLANYWPYSPWLFMTNVAGLGGTNVSFSLDNSTAGAYSVEYSTNLVNWYYLGPAIPRYLFIDTNAPATPQRFYRLRWP